MNNTWAIQLCLGVTPEDHRGLIFDCFPVVHHTQGKYIVRETAIAYVTNNLILYKTIKLTN